jgi:hypothetical protein
MVVRACRTFAFLLGLAVGVPDAAFAQAIAGVVHDASGAALPDVAVQAESSALIEKVRTVVTDGRALKNPGVTAASPLRKVYDISGTIGGPIAKDRVWYFVAAHRGGSPLRVAPATWSAPLSNRLLVEAGFAGTYFGFANFERDPNPTRDLIRVLNSVRAGARPTATSPGCSMVRRISATRITAVTRGKGRCHTSSAQ